MSRSIRRIFTGMTVSGISTGRCRGRRRRSGMPFPELIERALASPGELTIMAIGRQTNVALAVSIEPRFAESVAEIVVMGGSIHEPGNISPLATANIGGDPEAADAVYRSGGRVTQVGLDVVNSTEISGARQQRVWDADTPATRMLETATRFIRQAYQKDKRLADSDGVIYSDLSPMAYAIAPERCSSCKICMCVWSRAASFRGDSRSRTCGRRRRRRRMCRWRWEWTGMRLRSCGRSWLAGCNRRRWMALGQARVRDR